MSNAGAIRAGKAYVEVSTEEGAFNAALTRIQAKLKSFSESLKHLGEKTRGGELPEPLAAIARFAASPAGIFTAMTEMARRFAESGASMLELAEKAGTSVEAVSALAYAARRCNVDAAGLASGLKKMQQAIFEAARGEEAGIKASEELGLNLAQLVKLPAEQQFTKIAEAVSKIANPTQRTAAAVAVFGRNGAELLPLLMKGASGVDAFMAKAKELGLVMDQETAEKAKALDNALGDLKDVTMGVVKAIGGELAGVIRTGVEWITRMGVAVKNWIKDHRGLATVIFGSVAAITALGTAMTLAGIAAGVFSSALGVVTVATTVLSAAMAVLDVLSSPWVLLGAAIVAVGGYVLYATGAFTALGNYFSSTFGPAIQEIKTALSAMGKALTTGKFEGAWRIAGALMKLEFYRAFYAVSETWDGIVDAIQSVWSSAVDWMKGLLNDLLDSIPDWVFDVSGINREGVKFDRDTGGGADFGPTEAQQEHAKTLEGLTADLKAAQNAVRAAAEAKKEERKAAVAEIGDITATKGSSVAGTFGASALWGLGAGGPAQQIADNTGQANAKLDKIHDAIKSTPQLLFH